MHIRYVCGAGIEFVKGQKVACEPMAVCETAVEAANENKRLHSGFGYDIYEVDISKVLIARLTSGIRQGAKVAGYPVVKYVGKSYELVDYHN